MMRFLRWFAARPLISAWLFIGTATAVIAGPSTITGSDIILVNPSSCTSGTCTVGTSVTGPTIVGRVAATAGSTSGAYTPSNGTDTTVPLVHGSITSGNYAAYNDTSGTLKDSGVPITTGGSSSSCTSCNVTFTNGIATTVTNGSTGGFTVAATQTAGWSTGWSSFVNKIVPVACLTDCTSTLPASATLADGNSLIIQNTSNVGAAGISPVSSGLATGSGCSSCTTWTFAYSVTHTGDTLALSLPFCGPTGCSSGSNTITISSITYSGGSCANAARSTLYGLEIWLCSNMAASGSVTFTVTMSSSTTFASNPAILEMKGVASSSIAEGGNTATGTGTAAAVTLTQATTQRGDLIFGLFGSTVSPSSFTALQIGITTPTTGQAQYWPTNGTAQYTLNWNFGSSVTWSALAVAFKAAAPVSMVSLCNGSGTTLYGTPTYTPASTVCVPIMPGASVQMTVDGSGNYFAQLTPPAQGPGLANDYVGSYTLSLPDCYAIGHEANWTAAPTITVPVNTLPAGCVANLIEDGTAQPMIVGASGLTLQAFSGQHTMAGAGASAFVAVGSNGASANVEGRLTTP